MLAGPVLEVLKLENSCNELCKLQLYFSLPQNSFLSKPYISTSHLQDKDNKSLFCISENLHF